MTEVGQGAQRGRRALVTRRGRPFFIILGVEGEDLLDVLIRWDPEFWHDLERRRSQSKKRSKSLDELERTIAAEERRRRQPRKRPAKSPR
jgi:hypothetical protein